MNKKIPRPITISYCSGDMVHADFCYWLSQLCLRAYADNLHIGVCGVRTTLLEVGRIRQVVEAQKHNSSHILFLDSDMRFPPDTLSRLLRWQKPIVGCTYCQRRSPRALTHQSMDDNCAMPVDTRERLFEVKSLGLGCVLVSMEVFEQITRPWFRVEFPGGEDETGVDEHRSEDRTFFDKVRSAGFKVWCDAELSADLSHVGIFPFELMHAEVTESSIWRR